MTTPVKFRLAKLLKEKNYEDEDCENVYLGDFDEEFPPLEMKVSTRNLRQRNLGEFDCLAPTIADVVMWLYENYGIWISVDMDDIKEFYSTVNGFEICFGKINPSETYEAAIEYCLTNLI